MTTTNKWLLISESRNDSNRCTPCRGKPEQHATRPPRLICVWSQTIHLTWFTYDNISLVPTKSKQTPTPLRSLNNQRQTDPAVVLGGIILPPMRHPWNRGKKFQPSGYTTTSSYWAHKHQHAIGTFNTCSRGPTHRSLINTDGGYNLGGVVLSHITPRPFQPVVFTFHLWAPPDLQFNPVLSTKPRYWV
jgi:hypothetical protein